jgi:hypothetical protein
MEFFEGFEGGNNPQIEKDGQAETIEKDRSISFPNWIYDPHPAHSSTMTEYYFNGKKL